MSGDYTRLAEELPRDVCALAIEIADLFVCGSIECGSTSPNRDGWRMDCESDEYELRYAAKRDLIVRHPERSTWLRFTSAGEALL